MARRSRPVPSRWAKYCDKHSERYDLRVGCRECNYERPVPPLPPVDQARQEHLARIDALVRGAIAEKPTDD